MSRCHWYPSLGISSCQTTSIAPPLTALEYSHIFQIGSEDAFLSNDASQLILQVSGWSPEVQHICIMLVAFLVQFARHCYCYHTNTAFKDSSCSSFQSFDLSNLKSGFLAILCPVTGFSRIFCAIQSVYEHSCQVDSYSAGMVFPLIPFCAPPSRLVD